LELFQKDGAGNVFYVERESLAEEGVSKSELAEGFGIASRDELREKMLSSDAVFSF
jgi:sulfur relay (sulfurtransferase) DsrF/TusC family protein